MRIASGKPMRIGSPEQVLSKSDLGKDGGAYDFMRFSQLAQTDFPLQFFHPL